MNSQGLYVLSTENEDDVLNNLIGDTVIAPSYSSNLGKLTGSLDDNNTFDSKKEDSTT